VQGSAAVQLLVRSIGIGILTAPVLARVAPGECFQRKWPPPGGGATTTLPYTRCHTLPGHGRAGLFLGSTLRLVLQVKVVHQAVNDWRHENGGG
jgi:hypothetical protein